MCVCVCMYVCFCLKERQRLDGGVFKLIVTPVRTNNIASGTCHWEEFDQAQNKITVITGSQQRVLIVRAG